MCEFEINDKITINEIEIPQIINRNNKNKKFILVQHVAKLHNRTSKKVNANIKMNRNMFKDGIDIIDVKRNEDFLSILKSMKILTQNSINASRNVFLLSESGYMILSNIIEDSTGAKKVLNKYFGYLGSNIISFEESRFETLFRKSIHKIFDNIAEIRPQYYVDGYRIDIYIPKYKLAIEYDEETHQYKTKEDTERQEYIENKIGCKFIRVDKNEKMESGINKILTYIMSDFTSLCV